MYAIAFDMLISDLKQKYDKSYNNAYFEIRMILRKYGFYNTQGSVYLSEKDDMANLYMAIGIPEKFGTDLAGSYSGMDKKIIFADRR